MPVIIRETVELGWAIASMGLFNEIAKPTSTPKPVEGWEHSAKRRSQLLTCP